MRSRRYRCDRLDEARLRAADPGTDTIASWKVAWGEINRFQRLNDDITPHFDDAAASIPVPFTSAQWGSLASFGAKRYPDTKKYYGSSGNSFVAVVEFGDRVDAHLSALVLALAQKLETSPLEGIN